MHTSLVAPVEVAASSFARKSLASASPCPPPPASISAFLFQCFVSHHYHNKRGETRPESRRRVEAAAGRRIQCGSSESSGIIYGRSAPRPWHIYLGPLNLQPSPPPDTTGIQPIFQCHQIFLRCWAASPSLFCLVLSPKNFSLPYSHFFIIIPIFFNDLI